jgi:hypothetical protein
VSIQNNLLDVFRSNICLCKPTETQDSPESEPRARKRERKNGKNGINAHAADKVKAEASENRDVILFATLIPLSVSYHAIQFQDNQTKGWQEAVDYYKKQEEPILKDYDDDINTLLVFVRIT